jgi:hypothetical protein
MSKPRVYIETTIPSFYCTERTDPESIARRNWTRRWWDSDRAAYHLVTSTAVLDELGRGDYPSKTDALAILEGIPTLPTESLIAEIVEVYVLRRVMPADPLGDALHLALASYHHCDFLLTWNCGHLANANKFAHIRLVNSILNLPVPNIVTPLEMLGEEPLP